MNSSECRRKGNRLKKSVALCEVENNHDEQSGQCSSLSSGSECSSVFDDDDMDPTFDLSYSHQEHDTESSDSDSSGEMEIEKDEIEHINDTCMKNGILQDSVPKTLQHNEVQNVIVERQHSESFYSPSNIEIKGVIRNVADSNKENVVQNDLSPQEPSHDEVRNINEAKTFQLSEYMAGKRPGKKRTTCKFCQSNVTNFERHLQRHHSDQKEVNEILSFKKKSAERKQLIQLIRNAGHFREYLKGNIKPVYQKKNLSSSEYYPCAYCKGLFKRSFLYRHHKKCPGSTLHKNLGKVKHFSASQTLIACAVDASNVLDKLRVKNEVFNRMKADEISMVAKTDSLIYRYGERYLKKHKRKQMVTSCSNKMRELARLLIEIRKIEKDNNFRLIDAIEPAMFNKIVQSAKTLGGFNPETKAFDKSPSLSAHFGTTLQAVCDEVIFLIETRSEFVTFNDPEAKRKSVKRFKTLLSTQWTTEISSFAHKDLNEKKWNKPIILPLTKDVLELRNYISKIANIAAANLRTDLNNPSEYKNLVNATLVLTILYNRRRIGDVQYTKLQTYLSDFTSINQEECMNSLTESEKALTKFYKRIVTGGKGSRAIVILFPQNLQNLINVLIDVRMKTKLVPDENKYLFGQLGSTSWVRGDKAIQQFAKKCNLEHPEHISSNTLRKQIATVMQILNLNQEETEQFAQFMGHTTKTHDEFYKLPQDVYQTAKISKLLVLMDKGEGHKYKGKSLNEIEINPEVDIADEEECEVDESLQFNREISMNDIVHFPEPSTSKNDDVKLKPGMKTGRTPWSTQQIEVVKNYFKKHIERKQVPKKPECEELIKKYPDLLMSKGWVRIKTFVYNAYRQK